MAIASQTMRSATSLAVAPTARRMPISRMRLRTEAPSESAMLTVARPQMSSEISASVAVTIATAAPTLSASFRSVSSISKPALRTACEIAGTWSGVPATSTIEE